MKRTVRILHYWNEWKVAQHGDPVNSTKSRYRRPMATGGKAWVLQIAGTALENGSGDLRVFVARIHPPQLSLQRSKAGYQGTRLS